MRPIEISPRLAKLALDNGFTVSFDETFGQLRVDVMGTGKPMRAVFFADSPVTVHGFLTRHATRSLDDHELVMAVMRGNYSGLLNETQQWRVYCEADGYGYCLPEVLEQINDGWDWSHIRDSSPAGFTRMAALIRTFEPGFKLPSFKAVRLTPPKRALLEQIADEEAKFKGIPSKHYRTLKALAGRGLIKGIHQGIELSAEQGAESFHVMLTAEGRALLPPTNPEAAAQGSHTGTVIEVR